MPGQDRRHVFDCAAIAGFRLRIAACGVAGHHVNPLNVGRRDFVQRATYFQVAFLSVHAIVMRTIGAGSKYPSIFRDADGDLMHGQQTYRLHLPPNPPAALFWAVTACNITDRAMTEAPQLMPSINGYNKVAKKADGSIDLYFGPQKPANAPESNWIQTVGGRDFLGSPLGQPPRVFRRNVGTTERYAHLSNDPLQDAANQIGGRTMGGTK
jgi:hypothetical protein